MRDGFAWMKKHVSDHSAVNYIQQVIIRLLKTSDLSFQIHLLNEIDLESIKFVAASAGHESLWYQRRLFSKTFLIWISQNVWILENSEQNDFAENSSHFATSINSFLSMIQEYSITNNLHQFLSEDYDVTQDLNSQNNFFQNIQNILKSANLQQDNQHSFTIRNQQIIVAYIHKYLSLELDLVLGLLTDDMSWNPQLQLKYSLRYLYYLLHLVC